MMFDHLRVPDVEITPYDYAEPEYREWRLPLWTFKVVTRDEVFSAITVEFDRDENMQSRIQWAIDRLTPETLAGIDLSARTKSVREEREHLARNQRRLRGCCPLLGTDSAGDAFKQSFVDRFFDEYQTPSSYPPDASLHWMDVPIRMARAVSRDTGISITRIPNLTPEEAWENILTQLKVSLSMGGSLNYRGFIRTGVLQPDVPSREVFADLVWLHPSVMFEMAGSDGHDEVVLGHTVMAARLAWSMFGQTSRSGVVRAYVSIARNPERFFDPGPRGIGWVMRKGRGSRDAVIEAHPELATYERGGDESH